MQLTKKFQERKKKKLTRRKFSDKQALGITCWDRIDKFWLLCLIFFFNLSISTDQQEIIKEWNSQFFKNVQKVSHRRCSVNWPWRLLPRTTIDILLLCKCYMICQPILFFFSLYSCSCLFSNVFLSLLLLLLLLMLFVTSQYTYVFFCICFVFFFLSAPE